MISSVRLNGNLYSHGKLLQLLMTSQVLITSTLIHGVPLMIVSTSCYSSVDQRISFWIGRSFEFMQYEEQSAWWTFEW